MSDSRLLAIALLIESLERIVIEVESEVEEIGIMLDQSVATFTRYTGQVTDRALNNSLVTNLLFPRAQYPDVSSQKATAFATMLHYPPRSGTLVLAVHDRLRTPLQACQAEQPQDVALFECTTRPAPALSSDTIRSDRCAVDAHMYAALQATNKAIKGGYSIHLHDSLAAIDRSCHLAGIARA
jgi:hypothetical protein